MAGRAFAEKVNGKLALLNENTSPNNICERVKLRRRAGVAPNKLPSASSSCRAGFSQRIFTDVKCVQTYLLQHLLGVRDEEQDRLG